MSVDRVEGEDFRHRAVPLRTKFFYGLGAIAYGVKDNGFNYFLLIYYNQVLGLPASLAGLALLLTLVCDALSDPLVGHVSDRWRSRWGRRHPFMYVSALPVAVLYFFLWNPPGGLTDMVLFWHLLGVAVLVRTAITLFEVPSTALGAEFTGDYDQRTAIMGYRWFFGWWGGLTMALLAYAVFLRPTPEDPSGLLNREGFATYGLVASLIMFAAIVISSLGTHAAIPSLAKPPERRVGLRQTLRELGETLGNRSFLALFVSAVLLFVAQGFSNSLYNYFQLFFWELATSQIRWMIAAHFGAAALALVLAPRIAAGREKRSVAIALMVAAVVVEPAPIVLRLLGLFPENGDPAVLAILIGHSFVVVTLWVLVGTMISSMIADLVEDSQRRTQRRSEGLFFASRTFAQKVVSGLGVMLTGVVLDLVAFPSGVQPGEAPEQVLTNLGTVYTPIYVTFGVAAALVMAFYQITRASHNENLNVVTGAESSPAAPPS